MSDPKSIRLVLADVDGTLVTKDKILTERAQKAVHALATKGIGFAITSGRPPRGMAMLVRPLALQTPIAGFNGGVFVTPDLKPLEGRRLTPESARKAFEEIERHGLDVWVYTESEWQIRDAKAPHVEREEWTVKFPPRVVEGFDEATLGQAVKIVGVSDDLDRVAACEKDVQGALGDQASAARSQPYYLDVTSPQANKGAVVEYLSKCLKVPAAQIATMGDMPNDLLMFRKSGFSIAMGNASADVQKQASAVTNSNEEEGFAKALEIHFL